MLPESKYLRFFKEHRAELAVSSQLIGDMMLVEKIKFPEKKVGGIILHDSRRTQMGGIMGDEPVFYRILMAGAGYYDDETKADVPLDIEQGDIILTGSVSVKIFSSLPFIETTDSDILGVTRHGDIQWRWKGEAAFVKFLTDLNQAIKAPL